ncbi:MAG: hypothetical protein ACI4RD_00270 [Kiritimatiellia bacterium]
MATTNGSRHLTSTLSVTRSFDRTVTTQTYQGDQSQIESFLDTLNIGDNEGTDPRRCGENRRLSGDSRLLSLWGNAGALLPMDNPVTLAMRH